MNTKEIQEQLQDNQELTIKLGERLNSAEETITKLMKVKDYTGQLDDLKELLIKNAEQDKTTYSTGNEPAGYYHGKSYVDH